jgi:hypothetical protein
MTPISVLIITWPSLSLFLKNPVKIQTPNTKTYIAYIHSCRTLRPKKYIYNKITKKETLGKMGRH